MIRRTLAAAACVTAATLSLAACGASPTASSSPTRKAAPPLPSNVKAVIATDNGPGGFVVDGDSLWVANHRGSTLMRIDPQTNRVAATVKVDGGQLNVYPTSASWVCTNATSTVHHIDLATGQVLSSETTGCDGGWIDQIGSQVWTVAGPDANGVTLFDATTGKVLRKNPVTVKNAGGPLVLAGDRVVLGGGTTAPIFSRSGKPLGVVDADVSWLVDPVAGELWRVPDDGRLIRLDPTTLKPTLTIQGPKHYDDWNNALTGDGKGRLWYRPDYTHIYTVDIATKTVTPLMSLPWEEAPTGILYAFGSLWITNFDQNTVWRVDVGT